ncbi:MAG: DUF21 domain-containing protein [Nitrospirae bacterium]|nr:DUF21 domain-containing protein [Nitrospirota bacterium]
MDILILLGLIGLSAVISTAEIGFFSVNETRLKALAQNGSKRAAKALQLRSDPQKLLSTILVGDRLVSTATPMFATFITLNAYGGKSALEETASFSDRSSDLQFDGRKGVDASLGNRGRAENYARPRRKGRRVRIRRSQNDQKRVSTERYYRGRCDDAAHLRVFARREPSTQGSTRAAL